MKEQFISTKPSLLVTDFFWNSDENRLRVGWRILAQAAILLSMLAGLRSLVFSFLRDYWLKSHPKYLNLLEPVVKNFALLLAWYLQLGLLIDDRSKAADLPGRGVGGWISVLVLRSVHY